MAPFPLDKEPCALVIDGEAIPVIRTTEDFLGLALDGEKRGAGIQ
jgi:hypothetical protein